MASKSLKPSGAGGLPATGADCSCGVCTVCAAAQVCASDTLLHATSAAAKIRKIFICVPSELGVQSSPAIQLLSVQAELPTRLTVSPPPLPRLHQYNEPLRLSTAPGLC